MIYYKSRHLSEKLNINLAKWKRWSRDFLSPDPLGGLQSGVARQFSLKDAFKVYFGGYLVGELKFTIPDAKRVIADLSPWLKEMGFFSHETQMKQAEMVRMPEYHLYIYSNPEGSWSYVIRAIMSSSELDDVGSMSEIYVRKTVNTAVDPLTTADINGAYVIAITRLFYNFIHKIG